MLALIGMQTLKPKFIIPLIFTSVLFFIYDISKHFLHIYNYNSNDSDLLRFRLLVPLGGVWSSLVKCYDRIKCIKTSKKQRLQKTSNCNNDH
uniref:Uncharacterized protein n=1 Tax=Panagrolaimus sp. PS1159 TaxID=55785 RepID=A0AC35GGU6_9BILA